MLAQPSVQSHRGTPPPSRGSRLLQFNASTYNAASHSVEAILSTGAQVNRSIYREELLIDPAAIDLTRAALGQVKLLDSHNAYELGAVLGTVSNVRIQGGNLIATLTFDQSAQGIAAEGQVARGAVTGVSIGYSVRTWTLIESNPDGGQPDLWRATSWELFEVSLVSVPADPGAGTRSVPRVPVETALAEGEDMLTRNQHVGGAPASVVPAFTAEEAVDFIDQARSFGVEAEGRRLVRDHIAPDVARRQLLAVAAERQRAATSVLHTGGHNADVLPAGTGARAVTDPSETMRMGMADALYSRMTSTAPSELGRQFRSMSMIDMIRYGMRQSGERNVDFLSATEIVTRMHTTSDFPTLLTGVGNRVLLQQFAAAPNPLKALSRKATIDDFRAKYSIKLGALPVLPLVGEHSEVKRSTTSEGYESYSLGTYATIFSLTRQAIINDDLGAFTDWTNMMARAASETEANNLVQLLTANSGVGPTLTDGNALFHSSHGNLAASGGAINTSTLSAARLAMRGQKTIDGNTLASVIPATLLVSPVKETEGEAALASVSAATASNVNPFAGKLSLAVEPRLVGNPWYVFADPTLAPVLEYAYLTGAEGPQMDARAGWDVLGVEYRVVLDFGCGVVDYRGAYRNPGA